MFHSYFERKNDKVLTFHNVHVPNFEITWRKYGTLRKEMSRLLKECQI